MTKHKKYSSCLVRYTTRESPDRTFDPPNQYVKGKVKNVKAYWGRMNGEEDFYYINVWKRISSSVFEEEEETEPLVLSKKELGDVVPWAGDCLWIWHWEEKRNDTTTVARCHIEVERKKKLTDKERAKCGQLARDLQKELDELRKNQNDESHF